MLVWLNFCPLFFVFHVKPGEVGVPESTAACYKLQPVVCRSPVRLSLVQSLFAVVVVVVVFFCCCCYCYSVYWPGLEKSGRLVAICDQKIFLATRSWAAVVNLATNFSTKGPVSRPQFCARFHVRTNGTVWRPEKNDRFPKTKFKFRKPFSLFA